MVDEDVVNTSFAIRHIKARVGHARFAKNVKDNYNNRCCFPECGISDRDFLIASHIARWADNRKNVEIHQMVYAYVPFMIEHLN